MDDKSLYGEMMLCLRGLADCTSTKEEMGRRVLTITKGIEEVYPHKLVSLPIRLWYGRLRAYDHSAYDGIFQEQQEMYESKYPEVLAPSPIYAATALAIDALTEEGAMEHIRDLVRNEEVSLKELHSMLGDVSRGRDKKGRGR